MRHIQGVPEIYYVDFTPKLYAEAFCCSLEISSSSSSSEQQILELFVLAMSYQVSQYDTRGNMSSHVTDKS